MKFDLQRVRANVRNASTEDLLDRATVYRAGVEPAALPVILEELRSRGVTPEAVVAHEGSRRRALYDEMGTAIKCQRCRKPAVVRQWGWHRLFGKLPVFPRPFYLCEEHRGRESSDDCLMNESSHAGDS
jgi:hypothetical protein